MGLLGPCEWPVLGYGDNYSGNLDDASIKAARRRRVASNHNGLFA
jgi:hypothetical protein